MREVVVTNQERGAAAGQPAGQRWETHGDPPAGRRPTRGVGGGSLNIHRNKVVVVNIRSGGVVDYT